MSSPHGVACSLVLIGLLVSAIGCDSLAREQHAATDIDTQDTAETEARDLETSTDATDTAATDATPDLEPLADPVWPDDVVAAHVAACHAWHAHVAAASPPPPPESVLDCAAGSCALDLELTPSARSWLRVDLAWSEPLTDEHDFGYPSMFLVDAAGRTHDLDRHRDAQLRRLHFDGLVPHGTWQLAVRSAGGDVLPMGVAVHPEPLEITGDTELTWTFGPDDAVVLSGTVAFDGQAHDPAAEPWALRLTQSPVAGRHEQREVELETADYEVRVFPGTWRLEVSQGYTYCEPIEGLCTWNHSDFAQVVAPRSITTDTRLELDARRVCLHGQAQVADSDEVPERVQLVLRRSDGESYRETSVSLDADGGYELDVWPGTWTVTGGEPRRVLARDLTLVDDTALDLDLRTWPLEGRVLMGARPFPLHSRVEVYELVDPEAPRDEGIESRAWTSVEEAGEFVVERPHAASWVALSWDRAELARGSRRLVEPGTPSGPERIDVATPPAVPLLGQVASGTSQGLRGGLELRLPDGSGGHDVSLDPRAPRVELATQVIAGIYDLWLQRVPLRRCQPLTGVETLELEPDWRQLTVRTVDAEGHLRSGADLTFAMLADTHGYLTEPTFDVRWSGDEDVGQQVVSLVPGTWRITATLRDAVVEHIVEVR